MSSVKPIAPSGMELIFVYICPYCNYKVPLVSPTQPTTAQCDRCDGTFPILPVNERSVQYVKLMMGNGQSA